MGDVHEDIDQAFSRASGRLKSEDVTTLVGLLCTLRKTFGGHGEAVRLSSIVNWLRLSNNGTALRSVPPISSFH